MCPAFRWPHGRKSARGGVNLRKIVRGQDDFSGRQARSARGAPRRLLAARPLPIERRPRFRGHRRARTTRPRAAATSEPAMLAASIGDQDEPARRGPAALSDGDAPPGLNPQALRDRDASKGLARLSMAAEGEAASPSGPSLSLRRTSTGGRCWPEAVGNGPTRPADGPPSVVGSPLSERGAPEDVVDIPLGEGRASKDVVRSPLSQVSAPEDVVDIPLGERRASKDVVGSPLSRGSARTAMASTSGPRCPAGATLCGQTGLDGAAPASRMVSQCPPPGFHSRCTSRTRAWRS
jgi:hypothetical protein